MSLPVPAPRRSLVRAGTSPVALGTAAVGVAVGLAVAGGLASVVLLAVLAWLVGTGATLFVRAATGGGKERIDPFAVGEPWRHFVRNALSARNRFDDAIRSTRPGPLRDRLSDIRRSVDSGVHECWRVAQQAHNVSQARNRLDAPTLRRQRNSLDPQENPLASEAISAQLDSVARLDAVIDDTTKRLQVLEAQLTEAVTRAVEVGALAGQDEELSGVDSTVARVVDELEALRLALDETGSGPLA